MQRGAITKTGNAHLRRVLVESAWTYQHRPNVQGRVLRRQKALALSDEAKRIAWKAQQRLHKRFTAMAAQPRVSMEERSADCARQGTSRLYVGHRRTKPKRSSNRRRRLKTLLFRTTAVLITAEGIRKGEPSRRIVRYGFRTQPALSVRGSSRRIMAMRFRLPAYISVINRRASFPVVIGNCCRSENRSRLTSGNVFPLRRPSISCQVPERCSPARVRYAAPNNRAPLPAPLRSAKPNLRWAAPAGTLGGSLTIQKGETI